MASKFTVVAPQLFTKTFLIPGDAIDELGHVSNLKYITWMQEIAIQHSAAQGWPVERYLQNGAVWVVRSHFVTYVRPAFALRHVPVRREHRSYGRVRAYRR